MVQLRLLPHACYHIDATVAPQPLLARVTSLLSSKVFKVLETNVDGMEHLSPQLPPLPATTCEELAQKLQLRQYTTSTEEGIRRLTRLAAILEQNPAIVNTELSSPQQAPYYQAIHDYVDVFALSLEDLREPAKTEPFHIHTFGAPTHKPPIRCSPAHAKLIRDEIQTLKDVGLVKCVPTPWASPCFLVPKPHSDKLRLVIDYRLLNAQTRRDSHPITNIKDVVQKVGKHRTFSKLDLKSGFWQIALALASMACTGVCTPDELFVWTRVPFGVRNGPPAFQRAMAQILAAAGLGDFTGVFIDDVATGGDTHEEGVKNVRDLFAALEGAHLLAGADKVTLGLTVVNFLGY